MSSRGGCILGPELTKLVILTLVIATASCVSYGSHGPFWDSPDALQEYWAGRPLSQLIEKLGPADDEVCLDLVSCFGEMRYLVWDLTDECAFRVSTTRGSTISETEVGCEVSAQHVTLGLIPEAVYARACSLGQRGFVCTGPGSKALPDVAGLSGAYERFYEVYRIATEPQTVASISAPDFAVAFLALVEDVADEPEFYALFALQDAESMWEQRPRPLDEGPLAIPQTQSERGEARLLVDGRLYVLAAIRQLPVNLPTASLLVLPIPDTVMNELAEATQAEMRLPSGMEFRLVPATLYNVNQLVELLVWPEWWKTFAETGGLEPYERP